MGCWTHISEGLGKAFLTCGLDASLAPLNMGHCDAGLGGCSHQLTRSRAQARHRGGMKERACQKLDEVSRSTATTLHQDWEREPVAGDTLCLWACFSHGSAWPSLRFRYQSPKFWVLNQAHLNRQLKIKLPPAVSLAQETSFYPQHFLQLMLLTWASLASQFSHCPRLSGVQLLQTVI